MAIGTLVFGAQSYQNAVCLGLLVDERGRKMSKHLGNVLEPMQLMEAHGADAVRWFFAASGSPWATRRISADVLVEIVRKVLLTYWNTVSFLVLYTSAAAEHGTAAKHGAADEQAAVPAPADRPALDRWLLSELNLVVREVTAALESFDSAAAGRRITVFIDDLSNWYVRRSRRRFWDGPLSADGAAAFATLSQALETLTRLMAPITPFITDYVWDVLREDGWPDSVHLAAWPVAEDALIDTGLAAQMALARRLVDLGRSARAAALVKVRQPLSRALIAAPGFPALAAELRALIADELNVRTLDTLDGSDTDLVSYSARANFRALGKRLGSATQSVAAAIAAADAAELAGRLRAAGAAELDVNGVRVTISPEDVVITQTPLAGWAVASDGGETVALEVTITGELRREGLAREFIRLLQDARKNDGLDVTDRISVRWSTADTEVAEAISEHQGMISGEVLAVDFGGQPAGALAGTGSADAAGADAAGGAGGARGAGTGSAGGAGAGVVQAGIAPAGIAEAGNGDAKGGATEDRAGPVDQAATNSATYRHESSELGLTFWIQRR
jgi:isoleucyl-tRNA synthetase